MTMLRAPPQLPTGTQDLICSKPSIWIWRNDSRTTQADARQQGYTLPDSLSTFSPRVSRVEVSYLCTRKGVRLGVRSSQQLVGDNLLTVCVLGSRSGLPAGPGATVDQALGATHWLTRSYVFENA
jgi:hypothetical protein